MGARQYDPVSGRFLSVDPLFESFVNYSPYHYAYNNPISFKDPTGLAPEEEQGEDIAGDKEQSNEVQKKKDEPDEIQAFLLPIIDEESAAMAEAIRVEFQAMMDECASSFGAWWSFINDPDRGGGGGGGSSGNIAPPGSMGPPTLDSDLNPINGIITLTPEQRQQIKDNTKITHSTGVVNKGELEKNFWEAFFGDGKMTRKDFKFYSGRTGHTFAVNIFDDGDFNKHASKQDDPDGIAYTGSKGNTSTLTFQAKTLRDGYTRFGPYKNQKSYKTSYDLRGVILHEYGHAYAYKTLGASNYNQMHGWYKENWAIWYMNTRYCLPARRPKETYFQTWIIPWAWDTNPWDK